MCDGLLAAQELLPGLDILETVVEDESACDEIKKEFRRHIPAALSCIENPACDIDAFWAVNGCLGVELTVRDRLMLLSSVAESISDIGLLHLFTRSDTSMLLALSPLVVCHGGVGTLTEMPEVIASSRININTTMRPIRSGLPQRIWDVLGCGGFLLTNAQAEIPEFLEPGRHLAVYETPDEACELVRYYLTHEDERAGIANEGYKEVMARHTISARVASMISMIMETLSD